MCQNYKIKEGSDTEQLGDIKQQKKYFVDNLNNFCH